MLLELIVENYAVVEQARIRFGEGLNVLSGETGSGKSIVVDSLALLLGARASAEMVRTGESRARVSGIFSIAPSAEIVRLFENTGIEHNDEELIVEREVSSSGKSRAYVANRPVTTAFLRELAPALGDIHGQNDQQLLFTSHAQRELLDAYARAAPLLDKVGRLFSDWRAAGAQLAELDQNEAAKLQMLDLWTFQRKEIEAAAPRVGEDTDLEAERKILQNMTKLQESANAAFDALYNAPGSATAQLRQSLKRMDELVRIDNSLGEALGSAQQAALLLEETAYALRDYLGTLEGDPARLEDVESRLAALDRLKRKYGPTLEEVLAFHDDVARRMDEVENATEHRAALLKRRDELGKQYEEAARELSAKRKTAAEHLSKAVETELKGLIMSGTQLRIAIDAASWTAAGTDEIRFLVSPNRGEELRPMEKIASGGELSRIALALKTAASKAEARATVPTLVFDEVDAGIGGAAAAAVGKRLKSLSKSSQVICVTHLAQIAGFADQHFAISKKERKGRITTQVEALDERERAREVGRMLSGEQITAEALRQAEQLIQAGQNA